MNFSHADKMVTFRGVVKIFQHAPLYSLWGLPQESQQPGPIFFLLAGERSLRHIWQGCAP